MVIKYCFFNIALKIKSGFPYQFNEKAVTDGVESIGEKFEGDQKMSQVVVSLGVNF